MWLDKMTKSRIYCNARLTIIQEKVICKHLESFRQAMSKVGLQCNDTAYLKVINAPISINLMLGLNHRFGDDLRCGGKYLR